MKNNNFWFDGSTAFYLKLPREKWEENLEITLTLPKSLSGKYLAIVVADEKENIPVKNACSEEECKDCNVVYCPVYQEFATLKSVDAFDKTSCDGNENPIISGHENCHLGDCFRTCHSFLCGIPQGVSPVPMKPEDC